MRYRTVILLLGAALGLPASGSAAVAGGAAAADAIAGQGRTFFIAGDLRRAAHAFERALASQPGRADLHYWLGRSEARRADLAGPLFAAKHARAARFHLERACAIEPRNPEYARELFELYLDSPECFRGSLDRAAALLDRLASGDVAAGDLANRLAASRQEHSGSAWAIQRTILTIYAVAGRGLKTF